MNIVDKDHQFDEKNRYFLISFFKVYVNDDNFNYNQVIIMLYSEDGSYMSFRKSKEIINQAVGDNSFITGLTELNIKDAMQLHLEGDDVDFSEDEESDDFDNVI